MNNFELLLQTFSSSPDGIKFVLILCITFLLISTILGPLGLAAYVFLRNRELSFQMKEQAILGKAALKERKDLLRVVHHQQELLAVPDVDAELYNLPDCPIPVVKSLHSTSGEWPEEVRDRYKAAHQQPEQYPNAEATKLPMQKDAPHAQETAPKP